MATIGSWAWSPWTKSILPPNPPHLQPLVLGEDLMRSDVQPLTPDDTLDRALELFVENDLLTLACRDEPPRAASAGNGQPFRHLQHLLEACSRPSRDKGGVIAMSDDSVDYEPGVLRVLQSKGETKAFYNKIAKVYDLLSEHSERAMREEGIKMLAPASGEHLLEIGFGTGHVLVELAKAVGPTGKVFGIDLSENMLAQAQGLLEQENLTDRVTLACGDAEQLPYDSESMDGIFMCFTLELFDTPAIPRVLAECKRVLRPGGRIVVVAVSKEGKQGWWFGPSSGPTGIFPT